MERIKTTMNNFFAVNTLKLHNNDYTTAKENTLKVVLKGGNAVRRHMSRGC